jgi:hypothetical protein
MSKSYEHCVEGDVLVWTIGNIGLVVLVI